MGGRSGCNDRKPKTPEKKAPDLQGLTSPYHSGPNAQVTPTGLEVPSKSSGNTHISKGRGTESGTVCAAEAIYDPDLLTIVEAWPGLPAEVRKAIVRLVEGGDGK